MAGHNKWSQIKHKKARVDSKRAKVWSACARDIIMAARSGGGDPGTNLKLSWAVTEAKRQNMPNDTIERAIKRGTGELAGNDPEEVIYEGYGPGGSAMLVLALTDNRARTAPLVKRAFDKNHGKQGEPGCVAYQFETKGRIRIAKDAIGDDALMELMLDLGAEDVQSDDEHFHEVICAQGDLEGIKEGLRQRKIEWESAERAYIPMASTLLDAEDARKALKLVEALEELDDVQSVASNFDIPEDVLAELAAS